jgi:hypothetical protein
MNSRRIQVKSLMRCRRKLHDVNEEFKKDRNLEKNQIEILEMKSSITQTKTQFKDLLIKWVKFKIEYEVSKIQ